VEDTSESIGSSNDIFIEGLDDNEKEESFICKECQAGSGILKPLDPEINPQHHLFLRTQERLQFGGVRRRRRRSPATGSGESGIVTLSKRLLIIWGLYTAASSLVTR